MDKNAVIEFFDRAADRWDAEMTSNDAIIEQILNNAEVETGQDILDVACGTGVMIPYYLKRNVSSITAIDISPEMVRICGEKFAVASNVKVICGDVEEYKFDKKFDRIVVYNAFPHFARPKRLIKILAGLLKEDGRLTVAHGASREAIDACHEGPAHKISNGLMSADSLKKLFDPHCDVEIMISNKKMYQVSGVRRDPLVHTHGDLVHSHTHGNEHHDHDPDENATPMEELLVLMKYLVSHNDAHAQEVADLARELLTAGKCTAYDEIMDAVADFDMVNAKLDGVLNKLTGERIWGTYC